MTSGERDLPLLLWFAVAALLCMSTLVLPMLAPDLASASQAIRNFGGQLGAATTGIQPAHLCQAVMGATLLSAHHAQRVSSRF